MKTPNEGKKNGEDVAGMILLGFTKSRGQE
jgi:hypothetical protein